MHFTCKLYICLPTEAYDTYFLDIGVAGYWEDYMPLIIFCTVCMKMMLEIRYYDLDFLQFNIGLSSTYKINRI
jgi:hypothetical protein